jgi:hypothetical protein
MKKPRNWLIGLSMTAVLAISACSGGGGGGSDDSNSKDDSSTACVFPDDPGSLGNATVFGVDSNDNGLRDDVELRILNKADNDSERSSMMVAAREVSKALTDYNVSMSSDEVDAIISRGISCLSNSGLDPVKAVAFLEASIVNTADREAAYREYNISRGGTVGSIAEYDAAECSSFIPTEGE